MSEILSKRDPTFSIKSGYDCRYSMHQDECILSSNGTGGELDRFVLRIIITCREIM